MSDPDQTTAASEKTVLIERERGSAGGVIAAIALFLLVAGLPKYMGLLPF